MVEHWSLLEADTNFHGVSKGVLAALRYFLLLIFDQFLEININLYTLNFVVNGPLILCLSSFLHLESSGVSIEFNLVNFVCCCYFLALSWASRLTTSSSSTLFSRHDSVLFL